jgi:hypothetical protein
VCALTYTTETVTFYNTLETFTFRCADNVNELSIAEQLYGNGVTQVQYSSSNP